MSGDCVIDPHPPSRDCMCVACRPSFDNGADDPAQRYDITKGVTGASADEWMAEAKWLIEAYGDACADLNETGSVVQVEVVHPTLLAHLRKYAGKNENRVPSATCSQGIVYG